VNFAGDLKSKAGFNCTTYFPGDMKTYHPISSYLYAIIAIGLSKGLRYTRIGGLGTAIENLVGEYSLGLGSLLAGIGRRVGRQVKRLNNYDGQ